MLAYLIIYLLPNVLDHGLVASLPTFNLILEFAVNLLKQTNNLFEKKTYVLV